jgi:hypothetical protein
MVQAANENLEWPHCPKGYQGDKIFVAAKDADLLLIFELDVITEHAAFVAIKVVLLAPQLLSWMFRDRTGCPDLTVRVGIAGAHHLPTIFKRSGHV